MKTEPDEFSFDDLVDRPRHTESWNGVRNYQARNFMRDDFKVGDKVLIYHSSAEQIGIPGLAEVVKAAHPDTTADEPERWVMVDVKATHRFKHFVSLGEIKSNKSLHSMLVVKRGQRLSIQPVTKSEWETLLKIGNPSPI